MTGPFRLGVVDVAGKFSDHGYQVVARRINRYQQLGYNPTLIKSEAIDLNGDGKKEFVYRYDLDGDGKVNSQADLEVVVVSAEEVVRDLSSVKGGPLYLIEGGPTNESLQHINNELTKNAYGGSFDHLNYSIGQDFTSPSLAKEALNKDVFYSGVDNISKKSKNSDIYLSAVNTEKVKTKPDYSEKDRKSLGVEAKADKYTYNPGLFINSDNVHVTVDPQLFRTKGNTVSSSLHRGFTVTEEGIDTNKDDVIDVPFLDGQVPVEVDLGFMNDYDPMAVTYMEGNSFGAPGAGAEDHVNLIKPARKQAIDQRVGQESNKLMTKMLGNTNSVTIENTQVALDDNFNVNQLTLAEKAALNQFEFDYNNTKPIERMFDNFEDTPKAKKYQQKQRQLTQAEVKLENLNQLKKDLKDDEKEVKKAAKDRVKKKHGNEKSLDNKIKAFSAQVKRYQAELNKMPDQALLKEQWDEVPYRKIRRLDVDFDGQLTTKDFELIKATQYLAIRQLDVNHDGEINDADFSNVTGEKKALKKSQLDVNADGKVDEADAEFIKHLENLEVDLDMNFLK